MSKNLTAIVARVQELTAGRQVLVILLDYWSVWLGGAYDETHYLSDDGDHPNAAGHEQIATAAADVSTAAVHP